jgi:hypothetical protein
MGQLISTLQDLQQEMNYIMSLAEKCYINDRAMYEKVYDMFLLLKPLSHKLNRVKSIEYGSEYYMLAVGRWLKLITSDGYGFRARGQEEFFTLIRQYGEDLVPYIRQPVRSYFEQLAKLTKQLMPCGTIEVSHEVIKEYSKVSIGTEITIKRYRTTRISVSADSPNWFYVYYVKDDNSKDYDWLHLDNISTLLGSEDLLPDIKEMYEELYKKVRPTKEHNENILKRMYEVIRPYRLARELTA